MEDYPSKLLQNAVEQFSSLPGVGRKSAMRFALNLLKWDKDDGESFGRAFIELCRDIKYCNTCFNISDREVCEICANSSRQDDIVCVVEDVRDVMAIEGTQQYRGKYHVLGGIISPMDGIGPSDLNIEQLVKRVQEGNVSEIIMALSTTMEGDTTNFYLFKRLKDYKVNITTIARGISFGDELEYADEITLGRSITNRVPYEASLSK